MNTKLSVEETLQLAEKVRAEIFFRQIKQADLIQPLADRGVSTAVSVISRAINGKGFEPRYQRVLIAINDLLEGGFMNGQ